MMRSLALLSAALLLEASVAFAPASAFLRRAMHALPTAAGRLLLSSLSVLPLCAALLCADHHYEVMR